MKFAYEDLSPTQFEKLILFICQRLLGISVQGFAEGPDGGRDAKFVGTAEMHPSKSSPWTGTTIVQAKHTSGYNRHFAETDFYNPSSKTSVLREEIPRIKNLRKNKQLDNYMLFSNRRLGGKIESEIREYLAKECDIAHESIYLCGVEQLEIWMKTFPDVADLAELDPVDSPLIISPNDLAEIVQAIARQKDEVSAALDSPPSPRVSYQMKNSYNNMSDDYAKQLRNKYLKETSLIRAFLAAPENLEILQMYESVVEEFQFKIIAKRKDFQTFDEVMEHLTALLFSRDPILRQHTHKRLTRTLLFYMYWNCDIGKDTND